MKRYLVFAGGTYYPGGGVADLLYDTDNLTMITLPVRDTAYMADGVNILDTKTGLAVDLPEVTHRILKHLQKRDRLFHQYYVRPDYEKFQSGPQLADAYRQAGLHADERARDQFFEELSNP